MARAKSDVPAAGAICALADAEGRLSLRVTPAARAEAITIADGHLLVKVRARPEDGKATAAVLALLGAALGIAPSRIELLRGMTTREKWVRIPPATGTPPPP